VGLHVVFEHCAGQHVQAGLFQLFLHVVALGQAALVGFLQQQFPVDQHGAGPVAQLGAGGLAGAGDQLVQLGRGDGLAIHNGGFGSDTEVNFADYFRFAPNGSSATNFVGFGARAGFNANRILQLEGEMNYDFERNFTTITNNGGTTTFTTTRLRPLTGLFGPKFQKFKEARDLITEGAAFTVDNAEELKTKMDHLLNDPSELSKAGNAAKKYVEENTGGTQKILQFIQENRLLTN